MSGVLDILSGEDGVDDLRGGVGPYAEDVLVMCVLLFL